MVPAVMFEQGLLGADVVALPIAEAPPAFDNCLIHRGDSPLTVAAQTFAGMCRSFSRVLSHGSPGTIIGLSAR